MRPVCQKIDVRKEADFFAKLFVQGSQGDLITGAIGEGGEFVAGDVADKKTGKKRKSATFSCFLTSKPDQKPEKAVARLPGHVPWVPCDVAKSGRGLGKGRSCGGESEIPLALQSGRGGRGEREKGPFSLSPPLPPPHLQLRLFA